MSARFRARIQPIPEVEVEMAETSTRCLTCGRFAAKNANFCSCCGSGLSVESHMAAAVDDSFPEASTDLFNEMELIDATEIVTIVRRPDDTMEVDYGTLDSDTAIALLVKGLIMGVMGEMEMIHSEMEEDDESEE